MSHYITLYKYGKCMGKTELQNFKIWGDLSLQSQGIFNKTIILLALVGYKIIVANSALQAPSAVYHLISTACLLNNCIDIPLFTLLLHLAITCKQDLSLKLKNPLIIC